MNKQLSLVNSNLDRIFRSPLSSFVDEFFSNELPLNLINREDKFPRYNIYYAPASKTEGDDDNLGYDKSKFVIDLALAGYSKENLDVYVTASSDVSCHSDTGSFDLVGSDPAALLSNKSKLAVRYFVTLCCDAFHSASLYTSVFDALWH
jgi:hypothetical protein